MQGVTDCREYEKKLRSQKNNKKKKGFEKTEYNERQCIQIFKHGS